MDENIKLIRDAAEKYGFNLEFRTKKALESVGYTVYLNHYMRLNDEFIEIDVIGYDNDPRKPLIIECKGHESNSFLILVKESNSSISYPRYSIEGALLYSMAEFISHNDSKFFTISGDFFNLKIEKQLKKLVKASKQDERNSLYKAQNQLINAIDAFAKENSSFKDIEKIGDRTYKRPFIIPLVVTNAPIWVIDYKGNNPKVNPYKWVLHRVVRTLDQIDWNKEIPSFIAPVVNICYLKEFLQHIKAISETGKITVQNGRIN